LKGLLKGLYQLPPPPPPPPPPENPPPPLPENPPPPPSFAGSTAELTTDLEKSLPKLLVK
jgi:hypothetical protein